MATFLELQERVQRRLIDLPAAVLAEVPDLINKAHKEIQRRHNFKVMAVFDGGGLLLPGGRNMVEFDGTTEKLLPTDFKTLKARPLINQANPPFVEAPAGPDRPLIIAPDPEAVARRYGNSDEGEPEVFIYYPATRKIEIWPLGDGNSEWTGADWGLASDADGLYYIYWEYWKYYTALSDDSDTDWFTENADWYLTFKATAEGFFVDWDEERATFWEQKAQSELAQLILADKNEVLTPMDTLVPYKNAHEAQLKA